MSVKRKIEDKLSEIEVEELRTGMRKRRETTSTSPSGRHPGIYKCFFKTRSQKRNRIISSKYS